MILPFHYFYYDTDYLTKKTEEEILKDCIMSILLLPEQIVELKKQINNYKEEIDNKIKHVDFKAKFRHTYY